MGTTSSKYHAVHHIIKADILSGKYQKGQLLPPENELVDLYSVSRTTIRQAISLLKEEQLVQVRQGKGTQVVYGKTVPTPFGISGPMELGKVTISNRFPTLEGQVTPSTQAAIIDVIQAEVTVSQALGVSLGTPVYRLQRVKLIGDTIFAYVVSYVPCTLAPQLEAYSGLITHLYSFLKDKYQIQLDSIEDSISAVPAGFFESKVLQVQLGTPLLLSSRVASSKTNIFDFSQRFIRADLYNLVIKLDDHDLVEPSEPIHAFRSQHDTTTN